MNTYILKLKGTKKRNTNDLEIIVTASTKSQGFNFAYMFFETGEYDSKTAKYGWKLTDFIPDAAKYDDLRGKYKVFRTSILKTK